METWNSLIDVDVEDNTRWKSTSQREGVKLFNAMCLSAVSSCFICMICTEILGSQFRIFENYGELVLFICGLHSPISLSGTYTNIKALNIDLHLTDGHSSICFSLVWIACLNTISKCVFILLISFGIIFKYHSVFPVSK